MHEHHIQVRRTARYYLLDSEGAPVRDVWLACHGYAQRAERFARWLEPLRAPGRLIAVPEALNRFYVDDTGGRHGPESRVGATWMTRDDRLVDIHDYVAYLDALVGRIVDEHGVPDRLTGLGFSQGAATIGRWAVERAGQTPLHRLIAWGSPLPPDLDLPVARQRLEGTEVLLVAGDEDAAFQPERVHRERERLVAAGIRVDVRGYRGAHRIEPEPLQQIAEGRT